MEKRPEDEPVPIKLKNQELAIAWYGLLHSIKGGFMKRGDAIKQLQEWDEQAPSQTPVEQPETAIMEVDE